ncbi:MAG: thiamine pyrophosphate-binding protein [Dehalococcoidia bacterium]|jgi:2-hydroxyacyl-CoA lyase 1|nr:thiamine pyrophosphate-binding protein [Dehalococcoidia bacterium]
MTTETAGDKIDGATILARSLKQQGVDYMFGVVGFPISQFASALQREGITYTGMRNEQAASYAAQAAGYLTGRPQGCCVVSGPGVIHALAGLANAESNRWPMILIGGASATYHNGMGAFQEENQVQIASLVSKYAHAVEDAARIPFYVEQAVRNSLHGRPGASYLDLPDDILNEEIDASRVVTAATVSDPPRPSVPQADIDAALAAVKSANNPLVIVGKGMAWARAEHEVRDFIDRTRLPYLATPMGKGVIPDDHELSTAAARTYALQNADLIVLLGARLNWILHFGLPPRFNPDVRVVQLDIAAEEIGRNVPAEVALVGDGKAVMTQVLQALDDDPWQYPEESTWRTGLASGAEENIAITEAMMADDTSPMNYQRVLKDIRDTMPADAITVSEGANTMDIGRTILENHHARTRLDAGTYGTMGVGMGFAIAAAVTNPGKRVVAVEGDAAFGFSGMEVETMVRYNLPITTIIINNNGIGGGPSTLDPDRPPPPSAMLPNAHYEKVIDAFGGQSFFVDQPKELLPALTAANEGDGPALINIAINPRAQRKPQQFQWHTGRAD